MNKRQSKPRDSGKALPLPQLLKFTLEIGLYQEESYYHRYLFTKKLICVTKHSLISKHLLQPSCERPFSPLWPHTLIPFLSSGCYISFNYLASFWVSYFYGVCYIHNYIYFSPVIVSYVNLVIRPARKPRRVKGNFFHPFTAYAFLMRDILILRPILREEYQNKRIH